MYFCLSCLLQWMNDLRLRFSSGLSRYAVKQYTGAWRLQTISLMHCFRPWCQSRVNLSPPASSYIIETSEKRRNFEEMLDVSTCLVVYIVGNISQVMLGQIGFKLTAEHPSFPLCCIIHFPVSCALGDKGQTQMWWHQHSHKNTSSSPESTQCWK